VKPMLGPNHKYYSEPAPAQPFYTLSQLLKLYGEEHGRRAAGGVCPCVLCADLRAHMAVHKASRNGGDR
jgi:hypothetical protein